MSQVTAVFDIDGVLATGTRREVYSDAAGWAYGKCKPMERGIAVLNALREMGVKIVLHTARWEQDREVTVNWLTQNEVPYDELIMDKPRGDIYVDDLGYRWPPQYRGRDQVPVEEAEDILFEAQQNHRRLRHG